jgi:hypothetical protein
MCLNVFIDIVIEFHHHFLIVTFLPSTPTYNFFSSLYTMTPFPTCYTTTFLFFHSRWSIPTFIQSIITFHVYTSPHIPHSTFYVVTGCAEHSGAQVFILNINHNEEQYGRWKSYVLLKLEFLLVSCSRC